MEESIKELERQVEEIRVLGQLVQQALSPVRVQEKTPPEQEEVQEAGWTIIRDREEVPPKTEGPQKSRGQEGRPPQLKKGLRATGERRKNEH